MDITKLNSLEPKALLADMPIEFLPFGDQAVIVQFEKQITPATSRRVIAVANHIANARIPGIKQVIPTFCSLAVRYNPILWSYNGIIQQLQTILEAADFADTSASDSGKTIRIPIVYGGEYGPDLEFVAGATRLTEEKVTQLHSAQTYMIYMLGLIGSCPYCGDLDSRLALKRRLQPRLQVAEGSVLIANRQTIIFPLSAPSGWHLIGRTPMKSFNPLLDPPSIFQAGDRIKFEPVSPEEAGGWNEYKQSEWNAKWNC
ncbi:5-oxoprolinase subunit PxpB [Paenibacillus piri]|uniref:5-oxoprolinase subunit PxpB n=1 Tax=Paenibacillus piri TaxID=2547395 RepID=A0A4V2ZU55_9BACL|nr:5-oxoprolinase subunit PxpB [Paenibacillus piri]TDF99464.1 5-oxoprolinase subunit PxpB [Paenibacillus piri]